MLLRSPRVAVTGWAASCWRGATWVDGTRADGSPLPVDLASNDTVLKAQGSFRLSQERVDPRRFEVVDGLRVTSAADAVCFTLRHAASLEEAVVGLDMTYHADLVTPSDVLDTLEAGTRRQGHDQALAAWRLGDENAWSPQEVRVRLAWRRLDGTRALSNRPVFDLDGQHLATPDLLDPATGVAVEYDGDVHLTRARRRRDLAREQRLRDHGLEPVTLVAGDLPSGGGGAVLAERIATARARAARLPASERRWTLEPPAWWVPTHTVSRRRALTGGERAAWLGTRH